MAQSDLNWQLRLEGKGNAPHAYMHCHNDQKVGCNEVKIRSRLSLCGRASRFPMEAWRCRIDWPFTHLIIPFHQTIQLCMEMGKSS